MSASASESKAGGQTASKAKGTLRLLNGKTVDERKAVCRRVQPWVFSGHSASQEEEDDEVEYTPFAFATFFDPDRKKDTISVYASPNYSQSCLGAVSVEDCSPQADMSVLFEAWFDQEWVPAAGLR